MPTMTVWWWTGERVVLHWTDDRAVNVVGSRYDRKEAARMP